jgi:hypothetical protein
MRKLLVLAVALLAACSGEPKEGASKAHAPLQSGWVNADGPGETAIVYRDGADGPGFALSCVQATKAFKITAPNPVEIPPIDKETATLILGDEAFIVPVAPGDGDTPSLIVVTPAVPQLLRAVADAKNARLVYRDGFVETGVDTEGKILAFSRQCETLTGVGAAP